LTLALSPILEAAEQQRADIDFSPVVAAIRESTAWVSLSSEALDAISERNAQANVDFTPVLAAIHQIDFSTVLVAIQSNTTVVDFAPILDELSRLSEGVVLSPAALEEVDKALSRRLVQPDLSLLIDAINLTKTDLLSTLSTNLANLPERQSGEISVENLTLALSPILEAAEQQRADIDFSPVVAAIRESTAWVSLSSEALDAISERHAQVDHTPVLEAMDRVKADLCSLLVENMSSSTSSMVEALRAEMGSDVLSVLGAVRQSKEELALQLTDTLLSQLSSVQEDLRGMRTEADSSEVLEAIRRLREDVSSQLIDIATSRLPTLSKAIQDSRTDVDISGVTEAVHQIKADVSSQLAGSAEAIGQVQADMCRQLSDTLSSQLSVMLAAIRENLSAIDPSGVVEAIRQAKAALSSQLVESTTSHHSSMLEALRDSRDEVVCQVQSDVSSLLVGNATSQLSSLLQALQENRSEIDVSGVLEAIHQTQVDLSAQMAEHAASQIDFSVVVDAVGQSKTAIISQLVADLSSHLTDHESSTRVFVLEAIQENRAIVDLSGVSDAVNLCREALSSQVSDVAAIVSVQNRRIDVDLNAIGQALDKCQEELSARFVEVATSQASSLSDTIRANRTEVDVSGVLETICQIKADVSSQLVDNAASHISKVLEAITDSRAEVDLSGVLEAIRQLKDDMSSQLVDSTASQLASLSGMIQHSHTQVDLSGVLEAIRQTKEHVSVQLTENATAHRTSVLEALQHSRTEIDLSAVFLAIRELKVDLSEQLAQESRRCESRPVLDWSPVIREIRERTAEVHLSVDALDAISERQVIGTSGVVQNMSSEVQGKLDVALKAHAAEASSKLDIMLMGIERNQVLARELMRQWENAPGNGVVLTAIGDMGKSFTRVVDEALLAHHQTLLAQVRRGEGAVDGGEHAVTGNELKVALEEIRGHFSMTRKILQTLRVHPEDLKACMDSIASLHYLLKVEGNTPRALEDVLARLWDIQKFLRLDASRHGDAVDGQRFTGRDGFASPRRGNVPLEQLETAGWLDVALLRTTASGHGSLATGPGAGASPAGPEAAAVAGGAAIAPSGSGGSSIVPCKSGGDRHVDSSGLVPAPRPRPASAMPRLGPTSSPAPLPPGSGGTRAADDRFPPIIGAQGVGGSGSTQAQTAERRPSGEDRRF